MNFPRAISVLLGRRRAPGIWAKRAMCAWVLLALGVAGLRGQAIPPEAYAGFEGSTVVRVDVAAGPSVEAAVFQRLIQQKAGKPFSIATIRKSVAALQATKKFSAVQLSIEPERTGLALLFILQPASYVGVIQFPGATKVFPYTRLLQAVNIPDQSPFYEHLRAQGQKALVNFFRQNGYFTARVRPEIERDDPHRIVNLIFHANLGVRAKVGKIALEGVPQQEASRILGGLASTWSKLRGRSLKPGQTYSPAHIQKAANYIQHALQSQHRLAATVRFLPPEYDPSTNRANLTFQILPGPIVTVKVTGAHVSPGALKNEFPVFAGETVDRSLADAGARNLANYFQSKGYFDVKVATRFEQQPGRVGVEYSVERGPRYEVGEVTFQGNHYFDDDRLEEIGAVQKGHSLLGWTFTRGRFSNSLVGKTTDTVKALYRNAGFAHVSVHPKVTKADRKVHIAFGIDEGAQEKVESLRVEGNRTQPLGVLSGGHPLNLARGNPYSRHRIELDRNQILATYFNLGYLNAKFRARVTPASRNPHSVNVVYTITEGPRGYITEVVPVGEKVTRPGFLKKVTDPNVSPGKPLSQGDFYSAESNLYHLNIFDWVSVKPLEPPGNEKQDEVLVKVHESKRYTMDIGAGVEVIPRSGNLPVGTVALPGVPAIGLGSNFTVSQKSFWGPRISFSLARHNILGQAETGTFSTVISRLNQSGAITYADPRLFGSAWRSLFDLSAQRTTENPIYTAVLGRASFRMEKPLNARQTKKLILRYSFQRTDLTNILIPDLVLPQDQRVRLSTVSAEYIRDTRDNPLDAHRGVYQAFDFGVTPSAFGSSANFFRFLGQSAFYIPVRPWLTWANDFRLGFAIPFAGTSVPLSERFFSGGAESLRGFPINGAGPQRPVQVCSNPSDASTCTLISVPVGGDMLFIFNSEARFPLPLISHLGGVFFYDGGNVYRNINFPQWIDDYTNTVGAGLRYRTPVGPVRFDVGYRLTAVPGVRALQYFVTIGQAF
ncbi:MAG TPA: POTRA domain-containing protein [Patescibacteria group bacterium]|nr:POTRA domain-containing protein [Patescibacteria group bacterium]